MDGRTFHSEHDRKNVTRALLGILGLLAHVGDRGTSAGGLPTTAATNVIVVGHQTPERLQVNESLIRPIESSVVDVDLPANLVRPKTRVLKIQPNADASSKVIAVADVDGLEKQEPVITLEANAPEEMSTWLKKQAERREKLGESATNETQAVASLVGSDHNRGSARSQRQYHLSEYPAVGSRFLVERPVENQHCCRCKRDRRSQWYVSRRAASGSIECRVDGFRLQLPTNRS